MCAYDFVQARTHDGRAFKMLTIVHEFRGECLSIDVARGITSDEVLEWLAWLMVIRGVPEHIRSDNGSEFTARVVRDWVIRVGVKALFIEPGSPWENGHMESFNGKLRDELLNGEIFYTLREAKVLIEGWRPHSSLDHRPPAPEAKLMKTQRELEMRSGVVVEASAEACSAALCPPLRGSAPIPTLTLKVV